MTQKEVDEIPLYRSSPEGKTEVTIGVCGTQHDQWLLVQKLLDEQETNIYLNLVVFDAYNLPNDALNAGDIDLNAFQHKAYFNWEVENKGYELADIGNTYIDPLTLYSKTFDSVDAIKEAADPVK